MVLVTEVEKRVLTRHWYLLVVTLSTSVATLLNLLVTKGSITHRQKASIQTSAVSDANKVSKLLSELLKGTCENLGLFWQVLRDINKGYVVDHVFQTKGGVTVCGDDASETVLHESEFRIKIQVNRKWLKERVEARDLLGSLQAEGFLNDTDVAAIKGATTKPLRMDALLQTIYPKGLGANQAFMRALKMAGYAEIAHVIERTSTQAPRLATSAAATEPSVITVKILLHSASTSTGQSALDVVPQELVPALIHSYRTSLQKDIEHMYSLNTSSIIETPLQLLFSPVNTKTFNANLVRDHFQSGKLAKFMWTIFSKNPFFKSNGHVYNLILDVDYDALDELTWQNELGGATEVKSSEDAEGSDEEESDADSEGDDDETSNIDTCGCHGDGGCVAKNIKTNPSDGRQSRQTTRTAMDTLATMIKKHYLKGKFKLYNYNVRDVFGFLQKYRNIEWTECQDMEGYTILHQVVLENRVDLISTVLDAGLLSNIYDVKACGETSPNQGLSAYELARKMKLSFAQDELQRCKDIEESMNWLHRLSRQGNLQGVKAVHSKHPELLKSEAQDKTTALYWGVVSGDLAVVQYLVEAGSDVTGRSHKGDTLLTKAAELGHQHLLPYLINSCGMDPDVAGAKQKSPMYKAIENNHFEMVKILVKAGAVIEDTLFPVLARIGNLDMVKFALSKFKLNVNCQDRAGKPPLFHSLEQHHQMLAEFLVTEGADFMMRDKRSRNVLHVCAESGNLEGLLYVIKQAEGLGCLMGLMDSRDRYLGGERCFLIRGRDRNLLAYHYVEVDRFLIHIFRKITGGGGSLDVAQYGKVVKSGWGASPPAEAVAEIDSMYDASKVTPASPHDMTPLCLAILKEKYPCAMALIEAGCDRNQGDAFGLTPLHLAAMRGSVEVVRQLQAAGVNLNPKDIHGRTPMEAAKRNGHGEVVDLLKSHSFTAQHRETLQMFCERMVRQIEQLGEGNLQQVRNQGSNIQQYTISTLRDMVGEVNNLLYDLGTSPVMEESQPAE